MRIVLATGHPYIPQIAGGAQSSMHDLAGELVVRGHDVSVAAGLSGRGFLALRNRLLMKLLRRRVISDRLLGYPVHRAWFIWEAMDELAREAKPDVVFAQSGFPALIATECRRLDIPVVIYLRNVEDEDIGGDLTHLRGVRYVANSQFTAERYRQKFGIKSTVVHPLFQRSTYEVRPRRMNVTFINPHPHKGSGLALEIAERCPEIPFVFVEGWTLDAEERRNLVGRISALSNVALRPRTRRMVDVYRDARIVLVPSIWEEAFGRVVAEAHFSGIPVVASRRGGLPEAVGPGGILLDPEGPIESWVDAVRRLWSDQSYYRKLSQAAVVHADRPALNRELQTDALLALLHEAVAAGTTQ